MRKLLSGLVLGLGLAVAPAVAHADSFTYSLILTPTNPASNVPAGSGSFTINAVPAASGNSIFTVGNGLTDMSFSIGGDSFCLVSSASCTGAAFSTGSEAFFQNGTLTSVIYNGGDIDKTFDFSLNAGAMTYTFTDYDKIGSNGSFEFSQGTMAVTKIADPAPVPEPTALLLFGTGALGLAGIGFRKLIA